MTRTNCNEAELLTLMNNKNEFVQYIEQQYNNNNFCTSLETIIWAIHFNIPKYQRLPLLENIMLQNITHMKKCYNFLSKKQILGKTYELFGIPTVCGKPNKSFLNSYKKYTSYYPVRHPNMKKDGIGQVVYDETKLNTKSTNNGELISSTPISKNVTSFETNLLLSPITNEQNTLPIDIFHNKNRNSRLKNMSRNICYSNDQILSLPKITELNVLNMSSETFCDTQNDDIIETKNRSNSQSQMCFISRDPKNIQTDYSNISKLEINNSNNVQSAKYLRKRTNNISDNLNVLKKIKNKNVSIYNQPERNTQISKKSLSEKIKKNSSFKHIKYFPQTKNVILNSLHNIKTTKLKQMKQETEALYLTSNMSESWTKQTFSEISFSDLDEIEQTQIIMKKNQYKYFNKIEQDSITLEHNDTREKHMHNSNTDMKSLSYKSDNISLNFSNENSKSLTHIKHNIYNTSNTSSFIFSDDSVLEANWTVNSQQSDSIKREFTRLSQYSSDSNNDEKSKNRNMVTKLFNNRAFKQILYSKSKQNKTLSWSSAIDTSSRSSTIHISNQNVSSLKKENKKLLVKMMKYNCIGTI